ASITTVKPQSLSTANIEIPDMTRESEPKGIPVSISSTASFPLR
ncbi:MAG: phycobilisome rod-core linker polypeptide CpcG2, partial [Rivularia sp. (in: cyanobacteria)]